MDVTGVRFLITARSVKIPDLAFRTSIFYQLALTLRFVKFSQQQRRQVHRKLVATDKDQ